MKLTLKLVAIYNLIWGTWVVIFPDHFFLVGGYATPKPAHGMARNGNWGLRTWLLVGFLRPNTALANCGRGIFGQDIWSPWLPFQLPTGHCSFSIYLHPCYQ